MQLSFSAQNVNFVHLIPLVDKSVVMGGCSSSSEGNVDEEEQHDPKLDANGSHCIHEIENPAILIPDFVLEKQHKVINLPPPPPTIKIV